MKTLLPLLFLLIFFTAQGQNKLSNEPAAFVGDAKTLLVTSKVSEAEKLASELEAVWNSNKLSQKQQKQVIDIAQLIQRKRLPVNPYMGYYFQIVTASVSKHNLPGSELDNLLQLVAKVVEDEKGTNLERFMSTSSLFLSTGKLFESKNYKLYATGGSFSFVHAGNASGKSEDSATGASEWDNFSWDDETAPEESIDDGWGTPGDKPAKKIDPKVAEQKRKEAIKQSFIPVQPKVYGPVIKLENVNLTIVTAYDSTSVQKTSGQLMPAQYLFVGEGGSYEWEAIGKPASAIFRKYSFEIRTPAFKVPDVTLSYPATLEASVEGGFEFRSTKRNNKGQKEYPRFASFTNDAKMKNLGNNIGYRGGFTLVGDRIGSRPLDGSLSEVVVSHNGERKFRSKSHNFNLSDSTFTASRASIVLYQKKDSITHPAMQLRFSKAQNELVLSKDKGSYKKTPFFDTYHKMEITAERLQWNLSSPEVHFMTVSANTYVPVQLESTQYYSNNRYQQLIGVATFHPLQVIVSHAAKTKKMEFYAAEVASTSKINEAAIKEAAKNLAYDGYLSFNGETGHIALKPKALHYVGASHKTIDYDHLVIKSIAPSGKNATLNLNDNKLLVRGVDKITFNNDSVSVYAKPDSGIVRVLSKRDIEFNGQVFAGRLAFRGTQFLFNYDDFMIDMQKLDTVALMQTNRRLATKPLSLEQVLTSRSGKMSGKLYINKPNNKSGKETFSDYPKFDAPQGGQVAFSKPGVLGGAYDSTVYFDIPPFKMDSLSTGKSAVAFDGTFNSGGIFPPIKTKLTLMPDKTLGFYYQPSSNGLPAYGGKGMVYDTIMMSSSGIQSKGRIKYLAATLEAPDFTYYKEAVTTKSGTKATIKEGGSASYPVVDVPSYELTWLPKQDTMYIVAAKEPMQVYKEQYKFKGTAKLAPGGLYGSGELSNPTASIVSPALQFKERSFSGNHAQMTVKSDVEGKAAIKAQDVAIAYDLSKNNVEFSSEQKGVASIEFPKAQYKTSMTSAFWDIAKQKVSLKADAQNGNNYFYSMHPQQHGLRFKVATGEYDLKENIILAGGVPYISVADTYVVPDSGKVVVAGDATIKTLRNARVMADSLQQFHKLYAGNINVLSRKAFKGEALHDYYNAGTDSFKLKFSDFMYGLPEYQDEKYKKKLEKEEARFYTYASANVNEATPFYIFPRVLYRGKVTMHASKQHMDFAGDLKLNFMGGEGASDWFPYNVSTFNPADARIPIINAKTASGTPLYIGLHIANGYSSIYNTFVSKKQHEEDLDLFVVNGLLNYDKDLKEFKIGGEERAYGNAYEGNLLKFNEATKAITFEGKMNLVRPTKHFNLEVAGSGKANVDSSLYNLDAFMAFDLEAPAQALTLMAKGIAGNAGGSAEALDRSEELLFKLGEFVGDKDARKYKAEAAVAPVALPKFSGRFARSMVFSEVNLQWSAEHKAWYSVGKLHLSNMLKEDVNAQLDGYVELYEDANGEPVVNMYIQADPYTWYYVSHYENGLTLASSNAEFNKAVQKAKAKGSRGAKYGVYPGEPIEKNQFMEHFQKSYLKGKEGFKAATDQPSYDAAPLDAGADDPKDQKDKKKKKKGDPFGIEE
ncbi:hypothetical protein [Pontibacter sp. SGAir0037]|uniref:hypothetical protein n=1 Tax=Pontibacter sp. SGAir0037 TaxID=2571030 RepID=UPI0010CCB1CB|nr:hypothetical protein [Pontibacter sp. SGAir0037]QCR24372.1 hypothetical protein C1N53_19745 [Pontibacter sp. SGAir0037]